MSFAQAASEGLDDALEEAARLVVERAVEFMPVHDPANDPNPAINLAERISIEPDAGGRTLVIIVRAPHAAKHHEYQQLKHPRGGGPKYLERALLDVVPEFPQIIASKVRAKMQSQARRAKARRR